MSTAIRHFVVLALSLTSASAFADLPDRIFSAGFSPTLRLSGYAGYPAPLANANVELHFGDNYNIVRAGTDGTFVAGVETNQLGADTLVELVARGTGADAAIVWASPLGPASRLVDMADTDGQVTFDQEPFLHLNPRTTVAAAGIHAFAAGPDALDLPTFYRAIRARQVFTNELVYALAMVARGTLALPSGSSDTYAAASSLGASQQLYAGEQASYRSNFDCSLSPPTAYCEVATTLPSDPAIVPGHAWNDGETYSAITPFASVAWPQVAFVPSGATAHVVGFDSAGTIANVSGSNGSYTLTRQDGHPFQSYDVYPLIGELQVREHHDVVDVRVRVALGPAAQSEMALAIDQNVTYPDNPEIPPFTLNGLLTSPMASSADALAPVLADALPDISNGLFVLPVAFTPTDVNLTGAGYDVAYFRPDGSGTTERTAEPFTWIQNPASHAVTLDFVDREVTVSFLNEEESSVWRVGVQIFDIDSAAHFDGVMVPYNAFGWTGDTAPGLYQNVINGHYCVGPFGGLDELADFSLCTPPFGFSLANGGVADSLDGTPYGTWTVDALGRLLLTRADDGQHRGWEQVFTGADGALWLLEDKTATDAVQYAPTSRLTRSFNHL